MDMIKANKKAQEEMVGFVIIMLVVAIIFLVFLGIFLRQGSFQGAIESIEVSQFLDSMTIYTTECTFNSYSYETLIELIEECNNGRTCNSNKKACEVATETLEQLIESSWNFAPESPTKSYFFKAVFEPTSGAAPSQIRGIAPRNSAPCPSTSRGAEKPFSARGGAISITLELCL